jgi:amino acid adenylation domain-containing protein
MKRRVQPVPAAAPPPDPGRLFWTGVLAAGATILPRRTSGGSDAVEEVTAVADDGLAGTLGRLAVELGVPVNALLLAAHAKVLGALAGEPEVTTGLAFCTKTNDPGPLPVRVGLREGTWLELIRRAHATHVATARHAGYPVAELAAEQGLSGPLFPAVLDQRNRWTPAYDDTPLAVRVEFPGTAVLVRVRYRTDAMDGAQAGRIAGYALSALHRLAADPTARHDEGSLLSAQERRYQLEGLAGPVRELPGRRFHELFEERARAHPDRPAAVHGTAGLTYGELNAWANRLAHGLLARGVGAQDVVAVGLPRGLPWLATVLAILKAGGVYLPVDPQHPAERIAKIRQQAAARVFVRPDDVEALGAGRPSTDPGRPIGPDRLAYIYFTSGSTGEPKGAMCEHAGMLNHLLAKVEDLGVDEHTTVAQTAPQCFDISLWQLLGALLVGGRTRIVGQEAILDVRRFFEEIGDVHVLQVVPSYLDVMLAHLDREQAGPGALRCVSVTGEAVKKELVERWFARFPGIPVVNAYGLTETSDDTNHEVLRAVPDGPGVPLGPPIRNVRVYVVDERLEPVPLGAPGEIVFSGVCVGRGYVNDEQRTRAAFGTDPHRPGERLYRSGDFGRWRPDGKLEFLGRRDAQVKIRGFRIEIGEIESRLLRVPGIRDGAVIVDRGPSLTAFYTAPAGQIPPPAETVREALAAVLPEYMVPAALHALVSLPLTANGKVDKKALAALKPQAATAADEPGTPTERRLAAAWAEALDLPVDRIGRRHHFFDAGGTSLAAVRLLAKLDRRVPLRELHRNPVLADFAGILDAAS